MHELFTFSGIPRWYEDIRIMIGRRPSVWWRINLQFLTPALILVSFIELCVEERKGPVCDRFVFIVRNHEVPCWLLFNA